MRIEDGVGNHMYSIMQLLLAHIHPHTSVRDYIAHTKMDRGNIWGTDVEIFMFANLCQTNVYVYSVKQKCWCFFTQLLITQPECVHRVSVLYSFISTL